MSPDQIAQELTAVTDTITTAWEGADLQYCLEGVEERLTDLIARIYQEEK